MPRLTASLSAMRAAVVSVMRNVPLFFAERPRTPLRVMCIMAFDALQILRHAKPLSGAKRQTLAALLDFGASLNARLDWKKRSSAELRATRALLDDAGVHDSLGDYTRRLATFETGRPDPGGEESRFHAVHAYRESVVRLSLGMLAVTASFEKTLDEGIDATASNPDLNVLFRIVMFCQIIDDVIDYPLDHSAKLPSFLTACRRLPQSLTLTRTAAREYATLSRSRSSALPLRVALWLTSGCVRAAVLLRRVLDTPVALKGGGYEVGDGYKL